MSIRRYPASADLKIYIFRESVDMRKQINGLVSIVQSSFRLDPFDRSLFLFCNQRRDKVKALRWDGDGFVLYYKRLEKSKFQYPFGFDSQSGATPISKDDLMRLLKGLLMEQFVPRKKYITM